MYGICSGIEVITFLIQYINQLIINLDIVAYLFRSTSNGSTTEEKNPKGFSLTFLGSRDFKLAQCVIYLHVALPACVRDYWSEENLHAKSVLFIQVIMTNHTFV